MPWFTSRWRYLLAIALVIPLGLATRSSAIPWPTFIAEHGGDALYAAMLYLGFRTLKPTARPRIALALAIASCFAIEFFQLYQAPWLNNLRKTLPGRLILGSGFLWLDLVRYTVGAAIAFVLDHTISHTTQPHP